MCTKGHQTILTRVRELAAEIDGTSHAEERDRCRVGCVEQRDTVAAQGRRDLGSDHVEPVDVELAEVRDAQLDG